MSAKPWWFNFFKMLHHLDIIFCLWKMWRSPRGNTNKKKWWMTSFASYEKWTLFCSMYRSYKFKLAPKPQNANMCSPWLKMIMGWDQIIQMPIDTPRNIRWLTSGTTFSLIRYCMDTPPNIFYVCFPHLTPKYPKTSPRIYQKIKNVRN